MKRAAAVLALALLAGCVPRFDPITVTNLNSLKNSQSQCSEFHEYEAAKKGQRIYDAKSERHLLEACKCFRESQGNEAKTRACLMNIPAYVAYEHSKERH